MGSKNSTVRFWPTFELDFTALISPNCTECTSNTQSYDAKGSLEDGFLEFTSNDTQVFSLHSRNPDGLKIYIHGRWALESVSLINETVLNATYGKAERHKVLIIEKAEAEKNGVNTSYTFETVGILGLAKK